MAEHIVSPLSTAMKPGWEAERSLKEDEETLAGRSGGPGEKGLELIVPWSQM